MNVRSENFYELLLNSHTSVNCLAAETVWSVEKFINFNPGLNSVFVSYHRTVLFYEPFTSGCLLAVSRLLKGTRYTTYRQEWSEIKWRGVEGGRLNEVV